jgi:acetyl-CoA C-acetyltransferase
LSEVIISAAKRTPIGGFQGCFSDVEATLLGSVAIKGALDQLGSHDLSVNEVLMGNVLPAGLRQAPARQATLGAGLGREVSATAISKVCGSGMKAVCQGFDAIFANSAKIVVTGGMESMTRAPYLSKDSRSGARLGHCQLDDHMILDGLEDACDKGALMGSFAENCATEYRLSREAQDEYALRSLSRAKLAQKKGAFEQEITPVTVTNRKGDVVVHEDEQLRSARPDRIPMLRPAFAKNGTITAANASSISDGAAALILSSRDKALEDELPIRAKIAGWAGHAQDPRWFSTAPIPATQKLLARIGWSIDDVELWEVNEAFAVVPMVFMQSLGIPVEKMNVNGGACALGHPIGASGARIIVTLLHAMEARDAQRGVAAICIGGGEGLAIAIERE